MIALRSQLGRRLAALGALAGGALVGAAVAGCSVTGDPAAGAAESRRPTPAGAAVAGGAPAARTDTAPVAATAAAPAGPGAAEASRLARGSELPAVRALYVNRFAAQSAKRMRELIAIADSTEVNGMVIDMKDEFGLNYASANPRFARNGGEMGRIRNVKALTDSLRAHGILPIARIVVFKDSVTARVNPEWTIRRQDGSIWRDHKGLAWVNPYHRALWDYNIGVAEELVGLGFGEVQFDYIRFPEPYKSLPAQVFPENGGQSKPDAIAEFLKTANARLDRLGVRTTADIFGLVTTVNGPLEVAQWWEKLSPVTDVLLPMVYPSHYPRGAFGIARPNAEPYKVINVAISRARERDEKLGLPRRESVRPYLQAFSLKGMLPKYGAEELRQQKQAVYDAGYDGWVLWSPGSQYGDFLAGLDRELTSRKRAVPTASTASAR